jgi:hypothetical protein
MIKTSTTRQRMSEYSTSALSAPLLTHVIARRSVAMLLACANEVRSRLTAVNARSAERAIRLRSVRYGLHRSTEVAGASARVE